MTTITIPTVEMMEAFGRALAECLSGGETVFMHGNLGAGKTTLVRGALHGFGYSGTVKSPTYTIVEHYTIDDKEIYHFDLYRLNDPEELEAIGIRDYFDGNAICFFEWPENGQPVIPEPDIEIKIAIQGSARDIQLSATSSDMLACSQRLPEFLK